MDAVMQLLSHPFIIFILALMGVAVLVDCVRRGF